MVSWSHLGQLNKIDLYALQNFNCIRRKGSHPDSHASFVATSLIVILNNKLRRIILIISSMAYVC